VEAICEARRIPDRDCNTMLPGSNLPSYGQI
jgi:hypothetical protein